MIDKKESVMIIDDSVDIIIAAETILEDEFEIYKCNSAEEANRYFAMENFTVDVVLLDLHLGGRDVISGEQFLVDFTAAHPDTLVIILSGEQDLDVLESCLEKGATHYLTKPFHPITLRTSVRTHTTLSKRATDTRARLLFYDRMMTNMENGKIAKHMSISVKYLKQLLKSPNITGQDAEIIDTVMLLCSLSGKETLDRKTDIEKFKIFSGAFGIIMLLMLGASLYQQNDTRHELATLRQEQIEMRVEFKTGGTNVHDLQLRSE